PCYLSNRKFLHFHASKILLLRIKLSFSVLLFVLVLIFFAIIYHKIVLFVSC
uniref:Uncharacterized protein n=1 Tax=Aegilops tauschii subsp. strangulata TaxID=200361 RepID=A0A453NWB8_AEGTS